MRSVSKLGYHLGDYYPAMSDLWQSGCRIAHVPDDQPDLLWHLHEESGGDMTLISTISSPFEYGADFTRLFDELGTQDPVELADRWHERALPIIRAAPRSVIWRAVNEPPQDRIGLLNLFELRRMQLLSADRWRAGIGCFSVGMPDLDRWSLFYPALAYANAHGHVLCLNEYFGGLPWLWYGPFQDEQVGRGEVEHFPVGYAEGWTFLRYRKVWREHLQPNGWGRLPMALVELGADTVAVTPHTLAYLGQIPTGWREMEAAWRKVGVWTVDKRTTYMRLLEWCDGQLLQDPYVIGACLFRLSDPDADDEWVRFNVAPLLEMLQAYIGGRVWTP